MNQTFRYGLGDKARDRISGLTGIITSRAEHLFGCARYWISPQDHKDGRPQDGTWLDEEAVEIVEVGAIEAKQYRVVAAATAAPLARAGGPTSQPPSRTGASSR